MTWRPWREVMADALYGEQGFYRSPGAPGRHFRTSAHVGEPWVAAIHELAMRVDVALDHPADFTVVDVGAGGGELLAGLADRAPDRWSLVGVDLASRPGSVPPRVEWRADPPTRVKGLILAVELLDVVPVEVVEITDRGPQTVEVTLSGEERIGDKPVHADQRWLERWWPDLEAGDRVEVGRYRDDIWRALVASLDEGIAVAIDYAVDVSTHREGTLTGFRAGKQIAPVTDGSCDLTAHVRFESLRHDGNLLVSQRDALRALGVVAVPPRYDDPVAYLSALSASGQAAELLSPNGLGAFTWLVHGERVDPESVLRRSTRAARTAAHTLPTRR